VENIMLFKVQLLQTVLVWCMMTLHWTSDAPKLHEIRWLYFWLVKNSEELTFF
jgi:hypothetical protein